MGKKRVHLRADGLWYVELRLGKSSWLPVSRAWVSRNEAARDLASNY